MKIIFSYILLFFTFVSSCHSQKLMQTVGDAKKISDNKQKFINKPLQKLLDEIKPTIKAALGNPEEADNNTLASISFYFTNKNEFNARRKNGENPTRILVTLARSLEKTYPKLSPNTAWTDEQTKIYGDMIIIRIAIIGEN